MQILVVDDAMIMRMMLSSILTKAGHTVIGEAKNGQEALDRYKELNPDLVTLDITMPIVDGIQAIKNIKDFDPSAKIIICSAMGQKALILEAIQAGAVDFIVKPFTPDRVLEAISRCK